MWYFLNEQGRCATLHHCKTDVFALLKCCQYGVKFCHKSTWIIFHDQRSNTSDIMLVWFKINEENYKSIFATCQSKTIAFQQSWAGVWTFVNGTQFLGWGEWRRILSCWTALMVGFYYLGLLVTWKSITYLLQAISKFVKNCLWVLYVFTSKRLPCGHIPLGL